MYKYNIILYPPLLSHIDNITLSTYFFLIAIFLLDSIGFYSFGFNRLSYDSLISFLSILDLLRIIIAIDDIAIQSSLTVVIDNADLYYNLYIYILEYYNIYISRDRSIDVNSVLLRPLKNERNMG